MNNFDSIDIANKFAIFGEFLDARSFGNGHINDTFQSRWNQAGTIVRYTHQRINEKIFLRPDKVMENILRVTTHIAGRNRAAGIYDLSRRCLTVVPARDGKPWARDAQGGWWRTYLFIEDAYTRDSASSPSEARFLGEGIGCFQKQLMDFPLPRLHDSIENFHNMEKRYNRFYEILKNDPYDRKKDAACEVKFLLNNEERGSILVQALREGRISERICHNDAKMNNILIDNKDSKALCVIDLDTVMPGSSLFDLGDLIRTVSNTAQEDEKDVQKVSFNAELFECLLEGYLPQMRGFLNQQEIELIPEAGRNITQIMALRFLADYLEGDRYFRIKRPEHNLDRCRAQIALIKSMDINCEIARNIVQKLSH
ncbi:MAG: aminoglycoside phosphotransferase family protein [Treponema sp.]|jgi:hypothetical protein|nr:aminoglycoside phosphotransferase family protein [Treponema sp.]